MIPKIYDWELDLGIFPGLLLGMRSFSDDRIYDTTTNHKVRRVQHGLYILFFDLLLTLWIVDE